MNKLIAALVTAATLSIAPAAASAHSPVFLAEMLSEIPRPELPELPELPEEPEVFGPVASADDPDPIWDTAPYRSSSPELDIKPVVTGELTGSCPYETPLTNEEVVERIWDRRR